MKLSGMINTEGTVVEVLGILDKLLLSVTESINRDWAISNDFCSGSVCGISELPSGSIECRVIKSPVLMLETVRGKPPPCNMEDCFDPAADVE